MRTVVRIDPVAGKDFENEIKAKFPDAVIVGHDVDVMNIPNDDRVNAMDLAIKFFAARGSNPQHDLIEVASSIYAFLTQE